MTETPRESYDEMRRALDRARRSLRAARRLAAEQADEFGVDSLAELDHPVAELYADMCEPGGRVAQMKDLVDELIVAVRAPRP